MKNSTTIFRSIFLIAVLSTFLSSCITLIDQGPRGNDGKVYYGIDYDYSTPYSYWDNNPNIPNNPYFGEMYRTERGTYDFEYFINPYEYWYGTYRLYQNNGAPGGNYGEPGANGADTYFLMICNENGFYSEEWEECNCYRTAEADGSVTVTGENPNTGKFEVKLKKVTLSERAPKGAPKYKQVD